ncbi:hypothetical protein [uncultured Hymenobacter sp.]|uniref:hypothetical protein n=1 Tax=uncultured Hymenobacter sp. TaxID=170016 RepID=UPI0035CC8AAC
MPTKAIHLEVESRQYRFVLKLLQSLPFVQVNEAGLTAEQQASYNNVKQGLKELKLQREGKLHAKPIQEVLDELSD